MDKNELSCPVDFVLINENKARMIAAFVLLLMSVYLLTHWWPIIAYLIVDFLLRAAKWGKYSLLGKISDLAIHVFHIKNKPVDRAPKRFAAGVGFVITFAMAIFIAFEFITTVTILGYALIIFAFLESALGFCAGCYIYSYGKKIFN